ncbi:hypothetical protein E2566_02480 [Pectobacterium punjabense]|uniref:Uncharacterized protein n=1 Tax=Pectobacterium punjabense TaxID=2108399 RepID=A0ABX6KXU5_9GAMM|nr:hypothetical protein [Pectobacterium punjabense]MBS4431162.1 hypothetical protein [Pectobacterium punjabense]PTA63094.1 hypothetical protein C9I36_16680 [Pectobacterium punjabense]QJA18880.1 hypothetical protein E2566_02480 [Pectobacterium punjabense]
MTHNNLDALINTARIGLEPLDAHYIAPQEAAFKNDYLTLLATLLLENGALNDNQHRLMTLLLPAINPSFPLSHYLQQASKLDADKLRHILDNLRRDQHASQALLFDFVVAQRIAGPLSTTTTERLSWIAKLTGLHEEQLLHINFWSMQLLGLTTRLADFSNLAEEVNIATCDSSYISNDPDKATFPQKGEFLTKGRYVYSVKEPLNTQLFQMFSPSQYTSRTVYIHQSCIVFNIIMNEVKSNDLNYGKNGEPVFKIIPLPTAFSAWQSFFYRELP